MLNKKFDMLAIGHNYLSYIYALDLLRQGKGVALIDDKRLNYGDLYLGSIGQLEKNFLQQWGKENQIEAFANFDRYLIKEPFTVILGQKRIRLGDNPCRNYMELARKLSFCFLSGASVKKQFSKQNYMSSFDQAFNELCWEITQSLCEPHVGLKVKFNELFERCPEVISKVYQDFSEIIALEEKMDAHERWTMRTFLYMLRGHHQVKLSFQYTPLQLFHLVLSLLSPNYRVDMERLLTDLHQTFLEQGGRYKRTEIADWRFHHSKPWRVQLNSFEGILRPSQISLFAGEVDSLPLRITPKEMVYKCLKVYWELDREITLTDGRVIYSSISKIGTDQSIWEMEIVEGRKLCFNVFLMAQQGCKVSFIIEQVRKMLLNDLEHICLIKEDQITDEKADFCDEIWIEERLANKSAIDLKKRAEVPFAIFDTLHSAVKLKNVTYYGPIKSTELGLLSSMMEIKFQAKTFSH